MFPYVKHINLKLCLISFICKISTSILLFSCMLMLLELEVAKYISRLPCQLGSGEVPGRYSGNIRRKEEARSHLTFSFCNSRSITVTLGLWETPPSSFFCASYRGSCTFLVLLICEYHDLTSIALPVLPTK